MKRFASLATVLALLLSLFSVSVFAADTVDVQVFGVADYSKAEQVFEQLNTYRQSQGLSKLVLDEGLSGAAMQRAVETSVYFSHTRPNGSSCSTIITQVYGSTGNWAENIACGQQSASSVMTDWKNSSGHNKNMLSTKVTHVGIGCVYVDGAYYWVQLFSTKGADNTNDYSGKTNARFMIQVETLKDNLVANSASSTVNITVDPRETTAATGSYTLKYKYNGSDGASVATLIPTLFSASKTSVTIQDSSGNDFATLAVSTSTGNSSLVITPLTTTSGSVTIDLPIYAGQADPVSLTINIHVHSYVTSVREPTCVDHGWTFYQCTGCGKYFTADRTEATGIHVYGDWIYQKEPTLYSAGRRYKDCVNCSNVIIEEVPALTNPYVDVNVKEYYGDSVLWANLHGITQGTDATHFSPNDPCTRAQVVTFLWRAFGEPEPTSSTNPFVDVKPGDYFYTAVLWAVEKGITVGTSDTTFSPDDTCTRAQVVTFLYRTCEEPDASDGWNYFVDVTPSQYYYNAVLWAVDEHITSGTDTLHFSPDESCTRAQIVTFLYRTLK